MGALSQNASSVLFSADVIIGPPRTAAAAIAKGQPCFLDPATGTVKLGGAAVAALANATEFGLAYYGAAANQNIQIALADPNCTLGATMTAGLPVQVHTTAGSMTQTQADLGSTNIGCTLGVAKSTTILNLRPTMGAALA